MNNYFEDIGNYNIISLVEEDLSSLMNYFEKILGKEHILSKSCKFIKWQYYNKERNNYNFLIGKNKHSNKIEGVIGYIPNIYYGYLKQKKNIIWLSNWSAEKNSGGLGLRLLNAVSKYEKNFNISALNVSEDAVKIYKLLKYKEGFLNHFYMVNKKKKDFSIIKNYDFKLECKFKKSQYILDEYKMDIEFFNNKYVNNPYYNYILYSIKDKSNIKANIVFRISEFNNSNALRIIDFCGDISVFEGMNQQFQTLMEKYNCEYIDFYFDGIDFDILKKCGFENIDDSNVIVPYHFEPFKLCNVSINYITKGEKPEYIFKGDGDRERPGIINGGNFNDRTKY